MSTNYEVSLKVANGASAVDLSGFHQANGLSPITLQGAVTIGANGAITAPGVAVDGAAAFSAITAGKSGVTTVYMGVDSSGGLIQVDGAWPIRVKTNGVETVVFAADGTFQSAGGIVFPSADPHIAGAWWDNAGTLTKSAG